MKEWSEFRFRDAGLEEESFTTWDLEVLDALVATPSDGNGAAVVVCHDLFGIRDFFVVVMQRLAESGFVTVAPDLFWRTGRRCTYEVGAELVPALERFGRVNYEKTVGDVIAVMQQAREIPSVERVGILGFSAGGRAAFLAGCRADPSCVVSVAGVGIEQHLDELGGLSCPTLLQVGDSDHLIPNDALEALSTLPSLAGVELDLDVGGHGFFLPEVPFYEPDRAERSWAQAVEFLESNLISV